MAQFKCTIAVLPKSTVVLAGDLPLVSKEKYETEKKINDEELQALISSELWKKEDKKKATVKKEEEKKE